MQRGFTTQIIAIIVLIGGIVLSGGVGLLLSASASKNKLVYTERAEDGDPPEVALGIAMGAFRGLFVNFLWIRANELKEDGKYHEAVELSKAITTLQPRFPRVWVFHAWNLAYNVSVETNTPEERWQWVQRGIELLRDEGIPANPNDMLLHKELAWFWLHKVAGITDESNRYYKFRVAEEWTYVLGAPPTSGAASDFSREAAVERFANWLRPIVEAPATLDELKESEPRVTELVDALAEVGIDPSFEMLRAHALLEAAQKSYFADRIREGLDEQLSTMFALMNNSAYEDAWAALLAHTRQRILEDEYNMEPWRMVRYIERYGPMDYRHPAAHALYWSARGVDLGYTRYTESNLTDFDFVNSDRVVIQSIQELYRSGLVYYDLAQDRLQNAAAYYSNGINVHFIDTYREAIESRELFLNEDPAIWDGLSEAEREARRDRARLLWAEQGKRPYRMFAAGYENFLRDSIRYLYRRGDDEGARKYHTKLTEWGGQNVNDPAKWAEYGQTLQEFVKNELEQGDRFTSDYVFLSEFQGSLQAAFINGLLASNEEIANRSLQYARQLHRGYMQRQLNDTAQAAIDRSRREVVSRDFLEAAGTFFAQFLSQLPLEDMSVMYNNAPEGLRQWPYDQLRAGLKPGIDEDAEQFGSETFDQLFPEPPGMAEHRARLQQRREEQLRNQLDATQQ